MNKRESFNLGANIIIWFLAGVAIYSIIKNWGGSWWDKDIWQVVASIATWLVVVGVIAAFHQVRQARKSTNAQIAMDLFRELRSDRALEIFRFIYSLKPEEDRQTLHTIDLHSIDYVLDRFDMLGALVDEGIVDTRLAIDVYAGVTALRCWYILHQYIWKVRDKRRYFGENVEAFTNRCLYYFDNNHIKVGFENTYITIPAIPDLVKKLKDAKKEKDENKKKLYPRKLKEIRKQRKSAWKEEIKKQREAKKKLCWHSLQKWCRNLGKRVW